MFNRFFHNGLYFGDESDGKSGGGADGKSTGKSDDKQADDDKKTFTQAELDALFGARAKQAAEKATADVLAALGVKTLDEAKAGFEKARKLEDEKLSEAEKLKKAADDARAETERVQAEHEKDKAALARLNLRREFSAAARKFELEFAGVQAEDDAFDLLKIDGDKPDLEAALKTLKKERPYLFGVPGEPPETDTKTGKKKSKPDEEAIKRRFGL